MYAHQYRDLPVAVVHARDTFLSVDIGGGGVPDETSIKEAARRMAGRNISPAQLGFVLDLSFPAGCQ